MDTVPSAARVLEALTAIHDFAGTALTRTQARRLLLQWQHQASLTPEEAEEVLSFFRDNGIRIDHGGFISGPMSGGDRW